MIKFRWSSTQTSFAFTLYGKKALSIWVINCILHVLFVLWIISSFNQITTFQSDSSSNNGSPIQVRFLHTAVNSTAIALSNNIEIKEKKDQIAKPELKLIASETSQKEILQPTIPKVEEKKENLKVEEKTQKHLNEKSEITSSTSSQKESLTKHEEDTQTTATTAIGSSISNNTSHSSQKQTTTSSESLEKSKTKSVALKALNRRLNYPTRARSLGVEGRVRMQFDITSSGTVTNIRVVSETPAGVFTDSVVKDMARWHYQTTGEVKNQIVNIVFKLDGRVVLDN
ncbi:TonB family protein [Acinetobacter pittii]|jgi:TonB family protein|uniref:TonB family protein n=1 Tax=Acinetobacter pittii TaxID=48296 RepID=UPI0026E9BE85|nr:TonB family protein [Acinetobacter pittii]MDO7246191.1 TonB family protein [Acinetobacter pittii]